MLGTLTKKSWFVQLFCFLKVGGFPMLGTLTKKSLVIQ